MVVAVHSINSSSVSNSFSSSSSSGGGGGVVAHLVGSQTGVS